MTPPNPPSSWDRAARLIGDKAYDSALDRDLAERYGIDMIEPHRGERREPTQDGCMEILLRHL